MTASTKRSSAKRGSDGGDDPSKRFVVGGAASAKRPRLGAAGLFARPASNSTPSAAVPKARIAKQAKHLIK